MSIKRHQIRIESILGGFTPTFELGAENQYLDGIGIDPEAIGSIGGITGKVLGAIMPTLPSPVLTTSTLGEAPMWISGAPETTGVFVYGSSGSVYALSNTLGLDGDGSQWKLSPSNGNGMVTYNDYVYFSTDSTIYRLGRLSATAPTMAEYWNTTLSGSYFVRESFSAPSYPNTRNITYPSHVLHFHNDGKVYVADYDNSGNTDTPHGGIIHRFKTDPIGGNGTAEWAQLVLPPGFMPTALESYGTDLAILCSPEAKYSSGAIPRTGNSALFLWDTVNATYYRHVPIKETVATAMKVKNGELYILAGNIDTDVKLMKYLGGEAFQTLAVINEGSPPPASAMEIFGNAVLWGGHVTVPTTASGVFQYGYRTGQLNPNALNMPIRIKDSTNTLPITTLVRSIRRNAYPVVGWRTDSSAAYGLDSITNSGVTQASRWRTKVYNIGQPFRIRRIRIPLTNGLLSGDSIVPIVYVDNNYTSTTLKTINTTNFSSSERIIDFDSISISGYSNFYIDFSFEGTNQLGFVPPIIIDYETDER